MRINKLAKSIQDQDKEMGKEVKRRRRRRRYTCHPEEIYTSFRCGFFV
jgi:hypothetical protein